MPKEFEATVQSACNNYCSASDVFKRRNAKPDEALFFLLATNTPVGGKLIALGNEEKIRAAIRAVTPEDAFLVTTDLRWPTERRSSGDLYWPGGHLIVQRQRSGCWTAGPVIVTLGFQIVLDDAFEGRAAAPWVPTAWLERNLGKNRRRL